MHSVQVRPPHEVKLHGHPDQPYVVSWYYPLMSKGRCYGQHRRHMLATPEKAEEFVIKHRVPPWRVPWALRKRLRRLARIASTIAS